MSAGAEPAAEARGARGWLFGVIRAARRRQRRRRLIVAAVAATMLSALLLLVLALQGGPGGGSGPAAPSADRPAAAPRTVSPSPGAGAQRGWLLAHLTDVNPGSQVQFVSSEVGFALSGQPLNTLDGGLAAPAGLSVLWPSAVVLATRDGGRHWQASLSDPAGFWGIKFSDPDHGWAVGVSSLYRTVDGGVRWQRLAEPRTALVRVAFTSATVGYGLTLDGRLFATDDGGTSWRADRWTGRGVAVCATSDDGFLLADENAALWRASTTGWVRVAAGLRRLEQFNSWWTDLSCQGANAVALDLAYCEGACGGGVPARARQTVDGGRTWRSVPRPFAELNPLVWIRDAAAFGERGMCFVAYGYAAVRIRCEQTNRHGRESLVPHLPFPGNATTIVVQGIDFPNATTGWLLVDQSTAGANPRQSKTQTQVWATDDSGKSWQISYRGPTRAA